MEKHENEDAYKYAVGSLAISDGAAESSYSKEWAGILVRAFVAWSSKVNKCPLELVHFELILKNLHEKWRTKVPWERLNWFCKEKAQQGAFATFLGIRLKGNKWEAIGIGDCNLFIVDATNCLVRSIPANSFKEFGTSPYLVPSVPGPAVERSLKAMWFDSGILHHGEWVIVATDAISAYLLYKHEKEHAQFNTLKNINSKEDFYYWVEKNRGLGMRNDDSTVVMIYR